MPFINPLYHKCGAGVYSAPYQKTHSPRTVNDLHWLYGKIAWASANCGGQGLDTATWDEKNFQGSGMYDKRAAGQPGNPNNKAGGEDEDSDDTFPDPIFIPKPHITSVRTFSDTHQIGAIRKCQLGFKVYDRAQLGGYGNFFTPGKDVSISFGWYGGDHNTSESFTGKIVNFAYSLSSDGGFDCSCEAIGAGPNMMVHANIQDFLETDVQPYVDEAGYTKNATSVLSEIEVLIQSAIEDGQPENQEVDQDGRMIALIKLPEKSEGGTAAALSALGEDSTPVGYIRFDSIVEIVNKLLATISGGVTINFPSTGEFKTIIGKTAADTMVSSNPYEMLIPNMSKYDETDWIVGAPAATYGDYLDCRYVYIRTDTILDFINTVLPVQDTEKKKIKLKIGDFFQRLFEIIENNCGHRPKLSLVRNADPSDSTGIYIVDINTISDKVKPTYITAVTAGSVVRNMSLNASLPADVSALFYTLNNAPPDLSSADHAALGKFFGFVKNVSWDKGTEYTDAKKVLDKCGEGDSGAVSALDSLNQKLVGASLATNDPKRTALVPLDLSITVDGTPGFTFGDVISTNYLPPFYRKDTVAFVITDVTHEVSDGDWTTTLSTVCKFLSGF